MNRFLFAFILIIFSFSAKATHIVGGEIGYRCLNAEGDYEITLTVYRDCYYGVPSFDDQGSIGFFIHGVDTAVFELLIDSTFSDTIVYELDDPCLSIPPDVCVEVMQYVDTISLPYNVEGYTIVYQRCCRNETLLNIQNPLETGASFVTQMTGVSMESCNSSPVFTNWPPLALCVDKLLDFDHSAMDLEGDSIVYSICTPFVGGQHSNVGNPMPQPPEYPIAQEVEWIDPPYNINNMLGGVPLSIDASTGQLTAIPNTIGQFVVGICMREYRDGVLLSETKRDFQFNVSDCGKVVSSFFLPEILCDELTLEFSNESINAISYFWDFGVENTDLDTSSLQNPNYTFPDTGSYQITLISIRSETCMDTFEQIINLQKTTLAVGLDWNVLGCGDSITLQVDDLTVDSVYQIAFWNWELSNDVTTVISTEQNPFFVIPAGGNIILNGLIESTNGCQKELSVPFDIPVILDLPDTLVKVCIGSDIVLNPNPVVGFSYFWQPPEGLNDQTLASPTLFNVQENQSYIVEVMDVDSICKRSFEVNIIASPNESIFAQAIPDTIFKGEMSQLMVQGGTGSYIWTPGGSLDNDTLKNPIATPVQTTTYKVISTNVFGCPDTATIQVVVLNPECGLPNVFVPTGFTPNNDGLNDDFRVYGFIVESVHLLVFDRWGEKVFETRDQSVGWDGTYKGEKLAPDVYGFYAKVGCINGAHYEVKGNVTLIR